MRSLEVRLKRLEAQAKQRNNHAPSQHEFLEANARQQVRRLYSAKSRLAGEEWVWSRLRESVQEMLGKVTEEQRRKDEDVEERYKRVHGPSDDGPGYANAARQRLRSVSRVGSPGQ